MQKAGNLAVDLGNGLGWRKLGGNLSYIIEKVLKLKLKIQYSEKVSPAVTRILQRIKNIRLQRAVHYTQVTNTLYY